MGAKISLFFSLSVVKIENSENFWLFPAYELLKRIYDARNKLYVQFYPKIDIFVTHTGVDPPYSE